MQRFGNRGKGAIIANFPNYCHGLNHFTVDACGDSRYSLSSMAK